MSREYLIVRSGPEPVRNSKGELCGCADCRAEVGDTQFAEFLERVKQQAKSEEL